MSNFMKQKWEVKGSGYFTQLFIGGKLIATAPVINVDESRLPGESWLSMFHRTEPERSEARNVSEGIITRLSDYPALLGALEESVDFMHRFQYDFNTCAGDELLKKLSALIAKHRGGK